jgi:hypothetical protein
MQNSRLKLGTIALLVATSVQTSFAQRAPDTTQRQQAQAAQTAAKETVRAELGKILQPVQQMLQMKQYKEALVKLAEADAIKNPTPYEAFVTEQMRGVAANGVKDDAVAVKAFAFVFESGRLMPPESLRYAEAITAANFRLKQYKESAKWGEIAIKEGSTEPIYRLLLIQSLIFTEDLARAQTQADAVIAANDKDGKVPALDLLKMRGQIAQRQKDNPSYVSVLERLVTHYPTQNYWLDWIARVVTGANVSDRYLQDVFRLQLALGENLTESQYVFLARNAIQVGFPIDAKQLMDHGYKANVLGTTAEHKTLRDKTNKEAADDIKNIVRTSADAEKLKEGPALFNAGLNNVLNGDTAKGIAMMEEGIKRPGLKRIDDMKLRLGITYAMAGQRDKSVAILKGLTGTDGLTEVAKLWVAYAQYTKPTEKVENATK